MQIERVIRLILEGREDEARKVFHAYVVERAAEIYRTLTEEDEKLGDEMAAAVEDAVEEFEDDVEAVADAGDDAGDGDFGEEADAGIEDEIEALRREIEEIGAKLDTLWQVEDEEHGGLPEPGEDGEREVLDEPEETDGEEVEECAECDGDDGDHDRRLLLDDEDEEEYELGMEDAEGRPVHARGDGLTEDADEGAPTDREVLARLEAIERELEGLLHGEEPVEEDHDMEDAEEEDDLLSRRVAHDEEMEEAATALAPVDVTMDPHREVGAGRSVRVNTRSPVGRNRREPSVPRIPAAGKGVSGYAWENLPKVRPDDHQDTFVNTRRRGSRLLSSVPKGGSRDALLNEPFGEPQPDQGGPLAGAKRIRRR